MAQYPIKLLKDESGIPFVPLTSMKAVIGEEYVQSTFIAVENSTGHFTITNDKLVDDDLLNRIIAVSFPENVTPTTNSYLKLNNGNEFLIRDENGTGPLLIKDFVNVVCFIMRKTDTWQLVKTGAEATASSGGHTIVDGDGNVLPQQSVLQFKGFGVSDNAGMGATVISTPALVNNLTTTESGTGPLDAYQGKVLNDKFANYLVKDGNAASASRLSVTTMPGSVNSADGYLHLLTWEITSAWSGMANIYALTDTEASQTFGTFGINYRTGSTFDTDGKSLSVAWLSGNLFIMPELTATMERTSTATIIRLYVKRETYRTYRLATVVDSNDRAVAKTVYSYVTGLTGTTKASSNGVRANAAAQLSTAHTLTVGNTGKTFNGSTDVSWSLSEIGAASSDHTHGLTWANLYTYLGDVTSGNWGTICPGYTNSGAFLKVVRTSASAPNWILNDYAASIAFGGSDTKGIIGCAYGSPKIRFTGGNGTAPVWYMTLTGSSGTTYDLNSISSKTTSFVQSSTPTANRTGDIWFVV